MTVPVPTIPNYSGLQAEIAKAAYSGMTDAQIVAALNTNTVTLTGPVSVSDALKFLRDNNLWLGIKANAAGASPALGAQAAVDVFTDPHTMLFDLTVADAQAMLANLVSNNLLTSAQAAALTALCQTTITIAQSYGFVNGVTVHDLGGARLWPGVATGTVTA